MSGNVKKIPIDLSDIVASAFTEVNKIVEKISDENPKFDFFDVFYRVHMSFIHAYISVIMSVMNELGTFTQVAEEFTNGGDGDDPKVA